MSPSYIIQKSTLTCPQSKKELNVMPCILTIYYLYMFFAWTPFILEATVYIMKPQQAHTTHLADVCGPMMRFKQIYNALFANYVFHLDNVPTCLGKYYRASKLLNHRFYGSTYVWRNNVYYIVLAHLTHYKSYVGKIHNYFLCLYSRSARWKLTQMLILSTVLIQVIFPSPCF